MQLSFSELAVLVAAGGPKTREQLALAAVRLYPSTKYDRLVALSEIKDLEARRFISKNDDNTLEITKSGLAALHAGREVVEAMREALLETNRWLVR